MLFLMTCLQQIYLSLFSDKETSRPDKKSGNALPARLPRFLNALFGSCICSSEDTPAVDHTTPVKYDVDKTDKECDVNPLKKYAPVSVPGWEVNVICKKI